MLDHVAERRRKRGRQVVIPCPLDMASDRMQKPERCGGAVLFDLARVAGVGEHPFREGLSRPKQQLPPFLLSTGLEKETFVRGHRVPGPVPEPRVAGDHSWSVDDELVGRYREHSIDLVPRLRGRDERAGAVLCLVKDRCGSARRDTGRPRPGNQLVSLPGLQLGREMSCVPKVLGVVQTTFGLDPIVDAAIPLAAWDVASSCDSIRAFEDETVSPQVDRWRTVGEALTMHIAPGAQGMELERNGAGGADDAVDDRDRCAPVVHRHLALDRNVADRPAPTREAILELEGFEVNVAVRVDRPRCPFVDGQRDPALADDLDGIDGGKTEHPAPGRPRSDHQQAVITTGPQYGPPPPRHTTKPLKSK